MQPNYSLVLGVLLAGAILWLSLLLFIVLKPKFFHSDSFVEQTALNLTNIHIEFLRYVQSLS